MHTLNPHLSPQDRHPVAIMAALDLLAGRLPNGTPGKFEEEFALDPGADLDDPFLFPTPADWVPVVGGAEEQRLNAGDPATVVRLLPLAVQECIQRLCDLPPAPYNLRLQQRLELAHLLELRALLSDYFTAYARMGEAQQEPALRLCGGAE